MRLARVPLTPRPVPQWQVGDSTSRRSGSTRPHSAKTAPPCIRRTQKRERKGVQRAAGVVGRAQSVQRRGSLPLASIGLGVHRGNSVARHALKPRFVSDVSDFELTFAQRTCAESLLKAHELAPYSPSEAPLRAQGYISTPLRQSLRRGKIRGVPVALLRVHSREIAPKPLDKLDKRT
ncbi:MAG: hypothetical protein KatS3mg021_1214 [Fimbriimonadales bacterium]|nr:MAG: hypothetical protein KatS3mg021_1214 [Fimbriimonadales bacterium]